MTHFFSLYNAAMREKKIIKSESPLIPSPLARFFRTVILATLHLLVVVGPLFFLVKNEEIFEFNKMLFTYACSSVILSSWLTVCILEKKILLKKTPFDLPILLFLTSQIISTILSIHPRTSLYGYYTRFHGGLFSTFAYIILFYASATFLTKKHVTRFISFTLLGATLASLYAFPEHFGHSPSCVLLDHQFNASCWIQDVQNRVFGTFGQPNWLAAYLILLLPLCVFVATFPEKFWPKFPLFPRLFAIALASEMFATLLFTRSRSGFLGCIAALIITMALLIFLAFRTHQSKKFLPIPTIIGTCMIGIALYFGTPYTPSVQSFILQRNQQQTPPAESSAPADRLEVGGTDSGEIRKIVWKGAINVWKRYPLFGSGVETFAYSYYRDRPVEHNLVSEWDFLYNKAHNELLNFLATTGFFGLCAYITLILSVLLFVFQTALSKEPEQSILAMCVLSGLIALHISNFFGFSTVMVSILSFVLPTIVLSYHQYPERNFVFLQKLFHTFPGSTTGKSTDAHTTTTIQWFGIGISAMIGIFLLSRIFAIWLADHNYAEAKRDFGSGDLVSAFDHIKASIQLSDHEALYYELYSKIAVQIALQAISEEKLDIATTYADAAITASNNSLILNPVHLNFYKTRNQVLVYLAQAQPEMYDAALSTLKAAQELAPTDAKITYYIGIIQHAQNKDDDARETLHKAIDMKSNYQEARYLLGQIEQEAGAHDKAKEQYEYILTHLDPDNQQATDRLAEIATFSAQKKKK